VDCFQHVAEMEQIHYRHTSIPHCAQTVDVTRFTMDEYALNMLRTYSSCEQSLTPISVSADGNCFFVALFGTADYTAALPVRCCDRRHPSAVCLRVPNILVVCSFRGPYLHPRSLYLIVMVHKNRQVIHKARQEPLKYFC